MKRLRLGQETGLTRTQKQTLSKTGALETVDDVCASLGSSSFLFAWWCFSGGCVLESVWRFFSSLRLNGCTRSRVVAYWISEAVGAVCFKVWVAFLSGSSRQPVPDPFTPVPLAALPAMKARKGRGVVDLVVPYLSSHLKPAMIKLHSIPIESGTYGDGGDGADRSFKIVGEAREGIWRYSAWACVSRAVGLNLFIRLPDNYFLSCH
ncbi:hypothetical protein F2Q70_00019027 [Brassica cretica]|uniref:Uncharacterized protein n=1 Tax=Brassica cretica TaxID=69181 RepID=A0A8S9HYG0_BRACR|nr:hypothetical protein F2Q70_00019027 [Brassica cretica]KAF2597492.1 hypothetical protein F2Q68_00012584 [Brassica cretica]